MIPAQLYSTVFLYITIFITVYVSNKESSKSYRQIKYENSNLFLPSIFCLIIAIWLGHRPISGVFFGDTPTYAQFFYIFQHGSFPDFGGEWIWNHFMYSCAQIMDVSAFFSLVEIGYFGFMFWGCYKLMPNGAWVAMLFCMGSFSFFSYGTNGIRNGLACSIVIAVLALITGDKKQKIIAVLLAFVAFNIHHSTGLPIVMALVSTYFVKSFKHAYIFWCISIIISLIAGRYITSIFASLGFDDRLSYLESEMDSSVFSHTGFRWDFLIYSIMPILLGYYIIYKRRIRNATYELLLNTYTLSNAFWIMVIRASFSNRFAYLSWFLYPIVLAYPLLKMDIWQDRQGQNLAKIMLAHIGFTWFMATIYY